MGIVSKYGKPITAATRPQNKPQRIRQGGGGLAAQSQIAAPPAPFQNPRGAANFQRNRTNDDATLGLGDGRSRNAANIRGGEPMSNSAAVRGAGYNKPVNYANYAVHDPSRQSRNVGTPAQRGRQASEVTRGKNTTGRAQPLYKRESNEELFGQGYKDFKKLHGSI